MEKRPMTAVELGIMQGSPPPKENRVTQENWDSAPFNRWSFLHVREVLPTIEVSRGKAVATALHDNRQDFDDLQIIHSRDGRQQTINNLLESTYTDGFIAIHKGKVVFERYFNSMTTETLHLSQSVAKSITATVCGILIHRGEIDHDILIGDVIPELKDKGYGDASLRHILDMRSGIKFNEEYADSNSDIAMIDRASLWKPFQSDGPKAVLDIPTILEKEREHGGYFQYRSIETEVMAWIMERTTGKRIAELVSEELWSPMCAEQSANFTVDRAGHALTDGGFNACLRDYARLGLLYLNNGKIDEKQLLPKEWVRETRQDGDVEAFKHYQYAELFPRGAYKNQFWVRDIAKEQIMARGIFGQMIYVDPSNDLVVAKLSTWPDFTNIEFLLDTLDAIDTLAEVL